MNIPVKANLDDYLILRTIGSGLSSKSYRAINRDGLVFGLKILDEGYDDRSELIAHSKEIMSKNFKL